MIAFLNAACILSMVLFLFCLLLKEAPLPPMVHRFNATTAGLFGGSATFLFFFRGSHDCPFAAVCSICSLAPVPMFHEYFGDGWIPVFTFCWIASSLLGVIFCYYRFPQVESTTGNGVDDGIPPFC